jgi:DNA-binding protein HU-beta
MNRKELAAATAAHTGIDPKTAAVVIAGMQDVILASVAKGEDVVLSSFVKFQKIKRPARTGRNPATGATIKIKAKTVAKTTALKGFKDVALGVVPAPKLNKAGPVAPAASKTVAKKTVAKKTVAKKTVAKKTVAKKTAPVAAKKK